MNSLKIVIRILLCVFADFTLFTAIIDYFALNHAMINRLIMITGCVVML